MKSVGYGFIASSLIVMMFNLTAFDPLFITIYTLGIFCVGISTAIKL